MYTNEAAVRGGTQPPSDGNRPYYEPPVENAPPPAPGVDAPPPPSQESARRGGWPHFDAIAPVGWDDEGTGSARVDEAARSMRAAGAAPPATIRQPADSEPASARVRIGNSNSLFDF
jgi:hypothetical protein